MTLLQSIALGEAGANILEYLDELETLAHDHDANIDHDENHDFECVEAKMEYQSTLIGLIKEELTKLKQQ